MKVSQKACFFFWVVVELEHLEDLRLRLALGLPEPALEEGVGDCGEHSEEEEKLPDAELVDDVVGGEGYQEGGSAEGNDHGRHVGHQLSSVDHCHGAQREVEDDHVGVDEHHCEVAQPRDPHLVPQVIHHEDSQKYADQYLLSFHQQELPAEEIDETAADEAGGSLAEGESEHELLGQPYVASSHLSEQLLSVVEDAIDSAELAGRHHHHAQHIPLILMAILGSHFPAALVQLLPANVLDSGVLVDQPQVSLERLVLPLLEMALETVEGEEPHEADDADEGGEDGEAYHQPPEQLVLLVLGDEKADQVGCDHPQADHDLVEGADLAGDGDGSDGVEVEREDAGEDADDCPLDYPPHQQVAHPELHQLDHDCCDRHQVAEHHGSGLPRPRHQLLVHEGTYLAGCVPMISPKLVALTTTVMARASSWREKSFLAWMSRSIWDRQTWEQPRLKELSPAVTPIATTAPTDLISNFLFIIIQNGALCELLHHIAPGLPASSSIFIRDPPPPPRPAKTIIAESNRGRGGDRRGSSLNIN